jgi:hypothetical protein
MARRVQHSFEDAEIKSKQFLIDILGKELSDRFFSEGKIEVHSGGNVYQLYKNGKIINETTNHSYCIVTNDIDLPIYDVIAIKYAWLKYRLDIVEKVANKTSLDYRPTSVADRNRRDGVGYDAFIHYMEEQGWRRECLRLNENNTNLVTTLSLNAEHNSSVVKIRCPEQTMLTCAGTLQVINPVYAHTISLYIADKNGKEINGYTKIRITKIKPSESVTQLARMFYIDISPLKSDSQRKNPEELFRWTRGIALHGGEYIDFSVTNPEINISYENVKLNMDFDFWIK